MSKKVKTIMVGIIVLIVTIACQVSSRQSNNDVDEKSIAMKTNHVIEDQQQEEPTLEVVTQSPTVATATSKIRDIDEMEQILIPVGEFEMGSTLEEAEIAFQKCQNWASYCMFESFELETPLHSIYLESYWIDKTPVTNAMYEKCAQSGVCSDPAFTESNTRDSYFGNRDYDNYPVIWVDWSQSKNYCAWVGGRLPSEAEWEKAARGTDRRMYPWGNEDPNPYNLNFKMNIGDTTSVDSYPQGVSPYGVFDLGGNVAEWIADEFDWYEDHQLHAGPPYHYDIRGQRGGSWMSEDFAVRATSRSSDPDYSLGNNIGFRCVEDTE